MASITFTTREQEVLFAALQHCLQNPDGLKINYKRLQEVANINTASSARNLWNRVKSKLMAGQNLAAPIGTALNGAPKQHGKGKPASAFVKDSGRNDGDDEGRFAFDTGSTGSKSKNGGGKKRTLHTDVDDNGAHLAQKRVKMEENAGNSQENSVAKDGVESVEGLAMGREGLSTVVVADERDDEAESAY